MKVFTENIPQDLKSLNQWVLWKYETRGLKSTKVPYQTNSKKAKSNDPDTWSSFQQALAVADKYDGIGIMFTGGLCGIDLDHHVVNRLPDEFAKNIIAEANTYSEYSPSGAGIHILFWGELPPGGRKNDLVGFECYDQTRFLTVTGDQIRGAPDTVNPFECAGLHRRIFGEPSPQRETRPSEPNDIDDIAILNKARSAANGAKFSALWAGDTSDYSGDDSRADLALCSELAFWTGGDPGRIDRLFRSSGLMREKWERDDYSKRTIEKALNNPDHYRPFIPPAVEETNMSEIEVDLHSPAQTAVNLIPPMPNVPPDEGTTNTPPVAVANRYKTSWSLAELYETEFPEPNWIIPGIIQEGLVLLAGRPKIGKSWMLLQIAHGVATGGKLFDQDIERGSVLYLALEDNPRRIKNRCNKMSIPKAAEIQFEFSWKPLHQGGLNDLLVAIEANHYRLIIIDTLSRAIPGVNHNDEQPIGWIMEQLQALAISHGITILPGDHTRKSNGFYPDPIDDIMGNTAKSKPIDAILAIYKEQGKPGANLRGRGRETPEIDLSLSFDAITGIWQSNGDSDAFRLTVRRKEILAAVAQLGKSQQRPLQEYIGEKDRGNFYRELCELVSGGKLKSETIGNKVYYYV